MHHPLTASNTLIDNAKYLDVVIPMNYLIGYSNKYSKTPESLCNITGTIHMII